MIWTVPLKVDLFVLVAENVLLVEEIGGAEMRVAE